MNKERKNDKNNNNDNNNITLKVMLYNKNDNVENLYSFVRVKSLKQMKDNKELIKTKAIQNICNKTGMNGKELVEKGYNKVVIKLVTKRSAK